MSDLFHIIFIFILFLIPLIYTLDFNSQNIFVYGIEEHQLGESTSKNFFTVMVGFHPQKYDPTIVTKAGGIIIYEYKPTIDALSANITEEIYTTLLHHPSIKYIERDSEIFLPGHEGPTSSANNLPEYRLSWGVDHVEADQVLISDIVRPQKKINPIDMCLLDSGIDYTNPQLQLSYKGGYDFVNNDSDPMDTDVDYHGTRTAGIIVAQFDGKEVVGVAPPIFRFLLQIDEIVNLYVAKIAERSTGGLKSTSEKGLQWCIEKNPQIIYMNYGSFQFSLTERDLIQKANEKGILLIAASGNGNPGINDIWYPSKHDEVIAVGSIDKKNIKSSFSNYGNKLDLVAPGEGIPSTIKSSEDPFRAFPSSGTSFAGPHVAGIAALIWSHGLASTASDVKKILYNTAIDLGQPGRDDEFGYGLANAKSVIGVIQSDIIFTDIDADNSHDDTISDTIVGKEITVTGALGTRQKTIGDISQICSEPCKFIGGETIKFTGSGPVPAPVITNQFGEFKTTFIAPPTAGTWEIQAHFAGNFDYRASDSQVLKYKTVLDTDNDGIANNVDLNPFVSSFKFSDQNNRGITIGEIDIISNLDIALVDELDDNGVRVKTYEGIGKASIFPCNSDSSLSFFKNTTFILTCNNIHLNVTNGNVDAKLISAEGITFNVNVPQGNDLEFNRLSLIFKASPSNTVVLKIIDDKGNQYDLAPGQTLDISSSSKKKIEISSIAKCNPGDFAIGGGFVLGGNATIISSKLLATENGWNATAFVFDETRISDNSTGNVTANVVCLDDSISSP